MQIYSLITVSLIWISHFDSNVDVTILYSCPHICLPPPPTQADAEAVRESIRGAFARGTIPSAASAGLLSHCLIARACRMAALAALPAHAHAAWPTRMGASLASPHRPRMPHRPPAITSAHLLGISLHSCGRLAAPAQAPLPRCPRAHPLPWTDCYAGTR